MPDPILTLSNIANIFCDVVDAETVIGLMAPAARDAAE